MTVKQVLMIHRIAETLGVTPSYFIDKDTGFLKLNFRKLVELRCSEIGIYSFRELEDRLGLPENVHISVLLREYDRKAQKDHIALAEALAREHNSSGN